MLRKPLFRSLRWSGCGKLALVQPLTYMNRSGLVVPRLLRSCRCSSAELVIVTDNLDLPNGAVRLKRGGSNRSHRGIASLIDALGTEDFLRLYVGIGRPPQGVSVVDHVLSRPEGEELQVFHDGIARAADAVLRLLEREPEEVMNDLNRRR
mgnify:CR=1 FL=1